MERKFILYDYNLKYEEEIIYIIDKLIENYNGSEIIFPDMTNLENLPKYIANFYPNKSILLYDLGFRSYKDKKCLYNMKSINTLYGKIQFLDIPITDNLTEKIYAELLYMDM